MSIYTHGGLNHAAVNAELSTNILWYERVVRLIIMKFGRFPLLLLLSSSLSSSSASSSSTSMF
jgi:hypothetical protein